jgi:Ca-activated chloride channel family protein
VNRSQIKHSLAIASLILFCGLSVSAQNDRKVIRQGVKAYEEGNYSDAEVQFRKAGDMNPESLEADFNTGTAMYGQEMFEETVKQYEGLVEQSVDPEMLASVWHNIGNSYLEAGQYEPSIEAFKKSLRKNPSDMDTKYNLAYARQKLEEQQEQEQNQDQQDKDQKDQDQQDKDKQDQEQQDQDKQDQDQQDQEQKDQEQQNQDQKEQEQQAQPLQISKEDAERMLSAIQQQEKDVKEKVDKKKAAAAKVKTEKDW